jgi:hypothetical protein
MSDGLADVGERLVRKIIRLFALVNKLVNDRSRPNLFFSITTLKPIIPLVTSAMVFVNNFYKHSNSVS